MRAVSSIAIGTFAVLAPHVVLAGEIPKTGATSYTTHYVFHPVGITETPGVGKVTALILVGMTKNTKGEAIFNNMSARCHAVKVEMGPKSYFNGACAMTDEDGDSVFSTFDSRELDKSQPKMDCGTHTIAGGTGKFSGITGTEPFACDFKPLPDDIPASAMSAYPVDVDHSTTWAIK